MSGNSDDDWFEKDIDEFVVQAPPSNVEHISVAKVPDADTATLTNVVYTDAGLLFFFSLTSANMYFFPMCHSNSF